MAQKTIDTFQLAMYTSIQVTRYMTLGGWFTTFGSLWSKGEADVFCNVLQQDFYGPEGVLLESSVTLSPELQMCQVEQPIAIHSTSSSQEGE